MFCACLPVKSLASSWIFFWLESGSRSASTFRTVASCSYNQDIVIVKAGTLLTVASCFYYQDIVIVRARHAAKKYCLDNGTMFSGQNRG